LNSSAHFALPAPHIAFLIKILLYFKNSALLKKCEHQILEQAQQGSIAEVTVFFFRSFALMQKNQKIKDHMIAPRIGPCQRHTLRF
jgi:hypothetical protein